jgi:predicted RNA-binding Zn ribbon-like protein
MTTSVRVDLVSGAPTLEDYRRSGFPMGGEPLAVDLADTLVTVTDPATDLIAGQQQVDAFWQLQAPRLPRGWSAPTVEQTRALRDHVRHLLVAAKDGTAAAPESLAVLTRASAAAPTSIDFGEAPSARTPGRNTLSWHGTGSGSARTPPAA